MRINHNIAALNTLNRLSANNGASQKNMEKLSSGLKINRAGDDAAGLAISEKMRGQIRGLEMASKNAQDGISLIQTAEGALTETHSILQRVRELVVQAGNTGTQDDTDLGAIQEEINNLVQEIGNGTDKNGISDRTEFNGKKLLNGDFETATLTFQIGANKAQKLDVNIKAMSADKLGTDPTDATKTVSALKVTDFATIAAGAAGGFNDQLDIVDNAIKQVSDQRSKLGAVQNRLEHTINNLGASGENLTAAESR
ncbi:flagellin Hag, partial [Bacillus pumilus]|uniref:flagellin Hag n=2 Tax=Bacillaceae TaxID=186817 RepID=UPI00391758E0